ncbi:MAG: IS4 family transposase [Desulfobacteraceae bacterium]|nr:IS4 family transposase [Desulfobacteraceae bacterium]
MSNKAEHNAQELQAKIDEFVERVSQFFNEETAEQKARETNFVQRKSKLTGHLFLTVFTFGMSLYGTPTLNQLVGLLNLVVPELDISREGLHQRITDNAVKFFEAMLSLAIELEMPTDLELSILEAFARILIFDSTSFQLPATLAAYFKGSGGDASEAAIKILFGYDLKSSQFFYVLLNGTDADHLIKSGLIEKIDQGDLEISDLGFFGVETFAATEAKGAFYLSRLKTDVTVYQKNEAGELEVFDLVKFAQGIEGVRVELEIHLKSKGTVIETRLIIERVPEQVKAERLRKLNQRNKKKGRQTKKRTKILQGVNLHITNATAEVLPAQVVRQFYTIRWQVELVFKNWKSNFALDKVTGVRPPRIKCMIYAKLLFIFVTSGVMSAARSCAWRRRKREVSEFQAAQHIKVIGNEWLRAIVQEPERVGVILANAINFITKRCLKGKSKKRIYPLEILAMIDGGA